MDDDDEVLPTGSNEEDGEGKSEEEVDGDYMTRRFRVVLELYP